MFKVWYRDFIVWSQYKWSSLVASLGEPLLFLLAFGFGLGRWVKQIEGVSYVEFIAPALIMATVMHACTLEVTYSSYTRMTIQRTFDAIAVTPVSLTDIVWGEILWGASKGCFSGMVMWTVFALFGLFSLKFFPLFLILCSISGLLFSAIGLLVSSYAKSYQTFNYYITLFISPMFMLSGTFFPLTQYPPALKILSYLFPLTHFVAASRFASYYHSVISVVLLCLMSLLCTFVLGVLNARQLKRRLFP